MTNNAAPRDASYQDYLLEMLRDPTEAAAYLEAAIEEDDPTTFLIALRQVAQAQGITQVARKAKLGRESLYKMLSATGNAELRTLNQLLHAMGLKLSVHAVQNQTRHKHSRLMQEFFRTSFFKERKH